MANISGEQMTWHKVTLDFEAPQDFSEDPSTFRDYRLDVTFTNQTTGEVITVPGYFAADGDAANSNATSGNIWRANFNPPSEGDWNYEASFRTGTDIAAKTFEDAPNAGEAVEFIDGDSGTLSISETDKSGEDFRAKGMIVQDEGTHFLQHQGDGDYFVRGGPGIPENFLASADFDNTANGRHDYSTHIDDFNDDDPTWDGDKGKAIIGASNYIAERGMNTIYMLTNTSGGDGQDVSPWTFNAEDTPKNDNGLTAGEIDKFSTYDVSKLAQWEIVFDHMDEKGIYKNVLLQETENDQQLNNGTEADDTSLDVERLVYMREMAARFGHNNGIQWNLGEENTNTDAQRADMAEYMKSVDGYDHLVVIHSFPGEIDEVYDPLLGVDEFDGSSFQTNRGSIRDRIAEFAEKSAEAGDPWVLTWDEDASEGSGKIEGGDNNFDEPNNAGQRDAFWGSLTAGGSGGNWYIRDDNAFSLDQNYDDFTQHNALWTWTSAAVSFFNTYVPFWDMEQADGLTSNSDDYVMAKDGEYYVVFLPYGEASNVQLDLSGQSGESFDVFWYNPRTGGELIPDGQVDGGNVSDLGDAPNNPGKDWVLLVRNQNAAELPGNGAVSPESPTTPPQPESEEPQNASEGAFQGESGTVVIQAESADPTGNWRETDIDGETILLWDAPTSNYQNADPDEALSYNFVADEAGTYYIGLNSGRVKSTMNATDRYENGSGGAERTDTGNDAYVSVVDVESGEVLVEPTKLFTGLGSSDRELRFGSTFDANDEKPDATVGLEAGKEYRLEVTGRSDGYALDMITLNKDELLSDASAPESSIVDSQPPVAPEPNEAPVANADVATTPQNTTVLVDVLANDSDPDGGALSLTDVSYNGNTSLVTIEDGKIKVNPLEAAKNDRVEEISYTVTDEDGATATAMLRVSVGTGADSAQPQDQAVSSDAFDLFIADADTNETLQSLTPGSKIDLDSLGDNATFYATTAAQNVDYVRIMFEGNTSVEKVSPYALFGDIDGDFIAGLDHKAGSYAVKAAAYDDQDKLINEINVDFEFV